MIAEKRGWMNILGQKSGQRAIPGATSGDVERNKSEKVAEMGRQERLAAFFVKRKPGNRRAKTGLQPD
jgi:hypothetical protein